MTELLRGICIIVLAGCIGLIVYSIVNAFKVNKKNKEREENAQRIFLAKIQKDQDEKNRIKNITAQDAEDKQESICEKQDNHKELNYDEYENVEIEENPDGKTLRDFFEDK